MRRGPSYWQEATPTGRGTRPPAGYAARGDRCAQRTHGVRDSLRASSLQCLGVVVGVEDLK